MNPHSAHRLLLAAGTVALAALLTIVAIGALSSQGPSAAAGTPTPEGIATPPPTRGSTSAQTPADPITARAQSILEGLQIPPGEAAAAAFVTTTYASYAHSLPDTAGIEGSPSGSDLVILVEVEGYIPARHSCGFIMTGCYDTGVYVAFDQALDRTLGVTYVDDPWSRDRPSPGPSVSERFRELRQFGTPVPLGLPK